MKKSNFYFGAEEEKAIKMYVLSTDNKERKEIYTKYIHPVMSKLVENIIFTYDFRRLGTSYDELHSEIMAHIYLNLDKFKPEYGTKAYSYFGTAAKRYCQQKSINKSFENKNIDSINEPDKNDEFGSNSKELVAINDEKNIEDKELIAILLDYFEHKKAKSKEENKIIEFITYLLKRYEEINIHNKKHFYILIREYTGLDTKTITKIMNNSIINCYKDINKKYINNEI